MVDLYSNRQGCVSTPAQACPIALGGFESETLQHTYVKVCSSKNSSPPYSPSLGLKEEVESLPGWDICHCLGRKDTRLWKAHCAECFTGKPTRSLLWKTQHYVSR